MRVFVITGVAAGLLLAAFAVLFGLDTKKPSSIYEAVFRNDENYVSRWLMDGGDPNAKNDSEESLLYIATGPKGGNEVLKLLLDACGNPNVGAKAGYSPLMNAASWLNLPAIDLLLAHGADPHLRNELNQSAVDVVGLAGGRELEVIARLKAAMASGKTPNHSLQPTQAGCAGRSAEFKR